jgi:tRNA1Val (adenine37-N6)-methyltransferase
MRSLAPDERLDHVNEQVTLIQKKNGLTYGSDAFLLSAFVRAQRHACAVDLGSGTGIIPLLLLARDKIACAYAAELQPGFVDLIGRNAAINGLSDRIHPLHGDVRTLSCRDLGGKEVDLVVSNPPYMRCDSGKPNEHEEKYIARHEVFGGIGDFCAAAGRILRWGGRFVTVWRPDRLTELLAALHDAALEPKRMVMVYADAKSEPCAVLTEAVKGASPSLRLSPPLLLYCKREAGEVARTLTPEAQSVYDSCRLFY